MLSGSKASSRLVRGCVPPSATVSPTLVTIVGASFTGFTVMEKVVDRGKDVEPKSKKKRTSKKGNTRRTLRTVLSVLRSFRVRRWDVDIDTGDFATNAYLFPVVYMLSRWRGAWRVNYKGDVVIRVAVDNSPFRILRAWLRTKF